MSEDKNDNAENDFEFARRIQYNLLVKGEEALEDMVEVARATEHPRAFEVLSGMMKNMADISNNLMDLHKKKKEFNKSDKPEQLAGPTTNNVFVGSTTDLQRMLLGEIEKSEMKDVTPDESK